MSNDYNTNLKYLKKQPIKFYMRVWFKKGYKFVVWKRFNKFIYKQKML